MKTKIYNVACISLSVLFLFIMAFIVEATMTVSVTFVTLFLADGFQLFNALTALLAGVIFCIIPALLFIGCLNAFANFYASIHHN